MAVGGRKTLGAIPERPLSSASHPRGPISSAESYNSLRKQTRPGDL